ncbi:hypothetical protein [Oceanobacillus jordanicus]|uniref:Uncharacterized protein n=1 Tax=Oceanobacillus jordanicus TaxID=2867266 RepID=A0AAW5B9D5_9BACI|nr:hypothetical protein [Oceanobacillus jordanicus]MCG3420598.1 hypothetical protein [Oceanobacillus jordanicus]
MIKKVDCKNKRGWGIRKLNKKKTQVQTLYYRKIRMLHGYPLIVWYLDYTLAKEKCEDSSGNSTSPKAPQEAIFTSEETKAVPTESGVFSAAVIKQFVYYCPGFKKAGTLCPSLLLFLSIACTAYKQLA